MADRATRPRPPARGAGERREAVRNALIESRLTPNAISLTGLALVVLGAALVWAELLVVGGAAFAVGSICDTLDGRYSRMSGKGTQFGAFLDSTLDRVGEGLTLFAVAYLFARSDQPVNAALCTFAVLASLMVSYTRARAEALAASAAVGFGSRPTRVVILSAGLILAGILGYDDPVNALSISVWLLAAISTLTTVQRILHVRAELRRASTEASTAAPAEL
ncbi:MAG: CDP-alcohol phosphatidyltransferase family protein [Solirubrobacteraceae bacterium]|nr:CDP-alcohol phosphatidyltransferase family protein [Solirubrobacteraceae bacterium]